MIDISKVNALDEQGLREELMRCSGSAVWAEALLKERPFADSQKLIERARSIWFGLDEAAWLEGFASHPKIGDVESLKKKFASTASWAGNEQAACDTASDTVLEDLRTENERYLKQNGFIFIEAGSRFSWNINA